MTDNSNQEKFAPEYKNGREDSPAVGNLLIVRG